MKLDKLTEKIKPHEIQWRVQSKGNGKTTVVPYLTNRCVMERFDEQFGATNWKNEFVEWRTKGVKCGISVFTDSGQWVTKFDGADETNIESTKGGFSDSMKRAAVQWGLGRDLYDYPMIQLEGEHRYISRTFEQQLAALSLEVYEGRFTGNYKLLKETAPPQKQTAPPTAPPAKTKVVKGDAIYNKIVNALAQDKGTLNAACEKYDISEDVQKWIKAEVILQKEQFEKA